MEEILIGTTDRTILVFIPDPASTTGAGKTGLAAAAVTVTYTRVETDNDVVHSDVTSSVNDLSALTDAHNDWGWKEVSATLSKGLYRLDIADAVFATGAWYAVVQVTITSGTAAATPKAFKLVNLDMFSTSATNLATAGTNYSATRGLSGTALPAAAADAAGGLPISDAGGLDLDAQIGTDIDNLVTRLGTPSNLGGGATVAANLADIEGQTDDIGTAGAGLTAVPWNAAWDAEVQSEVQDAIEANHLDHLIAVADPGGVVANSSFLAKLTSKSATPAFSSFDNTTDSLEALRDNTGTAGAGLTAVVWNASWDAEVQSEVEDALAVVGVTTTVTGRIDRAISAIFTTAMTEAYNTDGAAPTPAQALFLITQMLTEMSISGTTMTIKKLDGSTTAFTLTLDSSSTPTSVTRAT